MYTPHTESDIREMLDAVGVASLEELVRAPDAVALNVTARRAAGHAGTRTRAHDLRVCRSRNDAVKLYVVSRSGVLPSLRPARRTRNRNARRVPHRIYAVPSGSLAGLLASDLRVAELHLPAHRHGSRERVGVRRCDRARRSVDHGGQCDRTPRDFDFRGRPSELSRGVAYVRARFRTRRRRDAGRERTARRTSRRSKRASPTNVSPPSACRTRIFSARSTSHRMPRATRSKRAVPSRSVSRPKRWRSARSRRPRAGARTSPSVKVNRSATRWRTAVRTSDSSRRIKSTCAAFRAVSSAARSTCTASPHIR